MKKNEKKMMRVEATYAITTKVVCSFEVPVDIKKEELEELLEEKRPMLKDISVDDDTGEIEDIDEIDWELTDYDSDDLELEDDD